MKRRLKRDERKKIDDMLDKMLESEAWHISGYLSFMFENPNIEKKRKAILDKRIEEEMNKRNKKN